MFKSWKDVVIQDQQETIKRLNDELDERVVYEEKLISIINEKRINENKKFN